MSLAQTRHTCFARHGGRAWYGSCSDVACNSSSSKSSLCTVQLPLQRSLCSAVLLALLLQLLLEQGQRSIRLLLKASPDSSHEGGLYLPVGGVLVLLGGLQPTPTGRQGFQFAIGAADMFFQRLEEQ